MMLHRKCIRFKKTVFISDLLLHLPNSNLTDDNITLNLTDPRPLFNTAEVNITGKPTYTACPVGNGIHITDEDRIVYKFPVSEPWPCPFNINQCLTGFTLSFWFKWDYKAINNYIFYISLGTAFNVYRPPANNLTSLRWSADGEFTWYFGRVLQPDEWTLMTWKVNLTHSVGYINGFKMSENIKKMKSFPSDISNELHFNKNLNAGNFSVGPMQMWARGMSPVFIWRLYQEGLNEYDNK